MRKAEHIAVAGFVGCGRDPAPPAYRFAVTQHVRSDVLGHALQRGHKGQQAEQRAEHPHRQTDGRRYERDGVTAEQFQNGARLAAFIFGKFRHPRHFGRAPHKLEAIKCGPSACCAFDAPDIAEKPHESAGTVTPSVT